MFRDSRCLVAGGTGMIGRFVVKRLIDAGAKVTTTSLDPPSRAVNGVNHIQSDLTEKRNAKALVAGYDYVFNLLGVKGSPKMTMENPARFFVPMLQFNTNLAQAAHDSEQVKWYVYTSSVGVYDPGYPVMQEDQVWTTFPSKNDWFAGWAKRMGELLNSAYAIQDGWMCSSVVRPANVYGPYDNFNLETAMVIPSLIRKASESSGELEVWGDGSPVRDFIYADDVARGILHVVENEIREPINLGSGDGVSIKEIAETVVKVVNPDLKIKWLTDKPSGDPKRLFCMKRANEYGFYPGCSIQQGIEETYKWFVENKDTVDNRYDVFLEEK